MSGRSVDGLEQVGMNEGEHHETDPFDLDDHVFVFLHALHVAFIAFELSPDDAHPLVLPEIRFCEYLASAGIGCCQQAYKADRFGGDHLYAVIFGIPVDPERH